ncbi:hypothetical protein D8Y22_04315 [Salinadaptatus halalkaliphilus]|uniref:DUF7511 domain-containing protein n=1 Tax=Salinadaptatus halalkaliphilus TaxID=2419781 RepID=A0A4S3TP87_9EURY|nr:hypothetical protein [Salinadaptatus halalkaliphilus]THE66149.1 hypothetical protein D8Y22_04315 [Salinadaptatus halalkaliphilus]
MTPDTNTHSSKPDEPTAELDHVTIENDDAPDECAIFPRHATDRRLSTAWIVAHDDAFVALESMR